MKIVAGIDFGTSMSMIQTLNHDSPQPDALACQTVHFTQSAQAATPTLVRVDRESGAESFGEEAQTAHEGVMYENFKLDLWSEDAQKQQQAQELVERFFRYLFTCYQDEKNKLYQNAQGAKEETVVGHPVQWSEKEREVILAAARKAGFQNVRGKDEASASVLCVLTHNQEALRKGNYLQKGRPVNIMVLDMGAGTTDLAFVQVSEKNGGLEITPLGTWPPKDYPEVFGGSRIDTVLAERMKGWLVQCGAAEELAGQMIESCYLSLKKWKEYTVSAELEKEETVNGCSALNIMFFSPGMTHQPFPSFDRDGFEKMMAEELKRFVRTIQKAPEDLRNQTDLVFLTGGNSQWYWVEDILTGKNTAFGDVGLPKVKGKPSAIQKTTYPTETVSRGLVYRGQGIRFAEPPKVEPPKVQPPVVTDSSRGGGTSGGKKEGQAKENIFIEWNEKRAQYAFPDMKMMERLYIDAEVSLVVTDSGRVLSTTPNFFYRKNGHNYSALRGVEAIVDSTAFRTKENRLIGRDGRMILYDMAGRRFIESNNDLQGNKFIDCYDIDRFREGLFLDADGRVVSKLGTSFLSLDALTVGGKELKEEWEARHAGKGINDLYRLNCWDQPLESMQIITTTVAHEITAVAVGLTKKGSLMTRRPEAAEALHKMFPMLSKNPDGTLGGEIIEFCYKNHKLVLLCKTGTLRLCEEGKEKSQVIASLHIAHIAFVKVATFGNSAEIWALDDFGNLRKWMSADNYQRDQVMMKECIACADSPWDLLAMDVKGKVKYVYTSPSTSAKRRREVEAWNIHDQ